MPSRTFSVVVPDELLAAVEKAAGDLDVSRNRWVRQALEMALLPNERLARALPPTAPRAPERPSANFGSHERYGPRRAGKPFPKS